MSRHLEAYLIVLLMYQIPMLLAGLVDPVGRLWDVLGLPRLDMTGVWYFAIIAICSGLSVTAYLKFIRLRCATILAVIEVLIISCAMIAALEAYVIKRAGYIYTNLESIIDTFIALEVLTITISLAGMMLGYYGFGWYNKHDRPISINRLNPG